LEIILKKKKASIFEAFYDWGGEEVVATGSSMLNLTDFRDFFLLAA